MNEDNKGISFNIELFDQKLGFSLSENTINKIANGTSTLFAPASAWLKGEEAKIKVNYLPFYDKLAERKNESIQNLFVNVLEILKEKELKDEQIPDKFEDTDNLLLIQDNASTTSNEEFLKLWAKFYTEEACKPGSVTRKTIKLLESFDINVVKLLEQEIFPFCDEYGFYWGKGNRIDEIKKAQEFGIIHNISLIAYSTNINTFLFKKINENIRLYLYPNYAYKPNTDFMLTSSGLEIRNILKIHPQKEQLDEIFEEISNSSSNWQIAEPYKTKIRMKTSLTNDQKFIICNNAGKIIFPTNQTYKTYDEFSKNAIDNIEVIDDDK